MTGEIAKESTATVGAVLITGCLVSGTMKIMYPWRWGFWYDMYRRRRRLIIWLHDQPWW